MEKYKVYIDGKFTDSVTNKFTKVINPSTEDIVGEVPACTEEDVNTAVEAAFAAQKPWKNLSPVKRAEYLKKMADAIRENSSEIAKAVTLEVGKPLSNAKGEVLEAADFLDYHAEWARRIEGDVVQSDSPNENIFLYKEPLGVVACILPWNFPIYVMIRKLGPALITGNTVVMKPSSETPMSILEFARAIHKVGVPAGVINILSGKGSVVGKALSSNKRVNFVTVTGSEEAGKEIMKACSENITKVSLELGGKAPAIVMDDADIELAVTSIVNSRVANAGQICNCTERVYVHEKVSDEFIARVVERMKKVTIGDGMENPDSVMGPLINKKEAERVHNMVLKAVEEGAKVFLGGKAPVGAFYEPTVLVDCKQEMQIMQKEIFGPVLPIHTFSTLDEAITLANDSAYGLTSTLYTKDIKNALKVSNNIESGELYINRKQGEPFQGFHAGWKKSGIGGDDGKYGIEEFMQTRIVFMNY